jgi:hypothetical protein
MKGRLQILTALDSAKKACQEQTLWLIKKITVVKSFVTLSPGTNVIKLFWSENYRFS